MKLSYDYSELIRELGEEMSSGELSPGDDILILRSDDPVSSSMDSRDLLIARGLGLNVDYHPIVDWYYDDLATERDLKPSPDDRPSDAAKIRIYRSQFDLDRPKMKIAKVRDVLSEMESWNRVVQAC